MTRFFPEGSRVRSAASTAALLALCLALAGCSAGHNSRPDPSPFNTPPLNAYALSGGKITRFIPDPSLLDDPADRDMLTACRILPLASRSARSASIVITTTQFGRFPLHALIVGTEQLVLPSDLATMGIQFGGAGADTRQFILYPLSQQRIVFPFNSKTAYVGTRRMRLRTSIVLAPQTRQLVMSLPDLLTLLRERDRQRHQPPFIRNVQVIYDIRDYHK